MVVPPLASPGSLVHRTRLLEKHRWCRLLKPNLQPHQQRPETPAESLSRSLSPDCLCSIDSSWAKRTALNLQVLLTRKQSTGSMPPWLTPSVVRAFCHRSVMSSLLQQAAPASSALDMRNVEETYKYTVPAGFLIEPTTSFFDAFLLKKQAERTSKSPTPANVSRRSGGCTGQEAGGSDAPTQP